MHIQRTTPDFFFRPRPLRHPQNRLGETRGWAFNPNGTFDVTFEFPPKPWDGWFAQHTSHENLAATSRPVPTVKSLRSTTYTINPGFNGVGDKNLLKPGANALPVNGKGFILLTVTVAGCTGDQTGPGCDPDQDGLTNAQEIAFGTNSALADTDKNGVADGRQIAGVCGAAKVTDLLPGLAGEVAAGCMTRVRVIKSIGKEYAELRYRNGAQCPQQTHDLVRLQRTGVLPRWRRDLQPDLRHGVFWRHGHRQNHLPIRCQHGFF